MPAPTIVSADAVETAVQRLTAAGEPITGWRLRRVIGAGNPARLEAIARELATVYPIDAPAPEPEAPALPPAIADHLAAVEARLVTDLRGLISQAWMRAADLAERRVTEEVEAARVRGARLEAELAEAAKVLATADTVAGELAAEGAFAQVAAGVAEQAQRVAELAATEARVRLDELRVAVAAADRRADAADARLATVLQSLRPSAVPIAPAAPMADGPLPEVADRLKLPRPERDAYDEGRGRASTSGADARPSKRFTPGGSLGHTHPWWRAGLRDGRAAIAASANPPAEPPKDEAAE